MGRMRPAESLRQLLDRSFIRVGPAGGRTSVSTRWLGYLTLESLCSHRDDPDRYGREGRSFDAVMKRFLYNQILSRDHPTRAENLERLLDAYASGRRSPRRLLATKRVGSTSAVRYFGRKGRQIFPNAVADMRAQTIGGQRILSDQLFVEGRPTAVQTTCRHVQADLGSIICQDRSETSADEIYLLTGAVLLDHTGKWAVRSDYTRDGDETEGVYAPPDRDVAFRDYLNPLFSWNIVKPPVGADASPVLAVTSVTIMEKDRSPRERVYAGFQAAYSSAQLLGTLLAGAAGPAGVALAIGSILYNLLVALDDDDVLGTAEFRFDNVLSGAAPQTIEVEKPVGGVQAGNRYRYLVGIRYGCEDFDCPTDYTCRIEGPAHLEIPRPGEDVHGRFRVRVFTLGNVQAQVEGIVWRLTGPTGTTRIVAEGERAVRIRFDRTGSFVVTVAARIAGTDEVVTDTHRVGVDLDPHGNPPL